jgi:bacteriorhodopsin
MADIDIVPKRRTGTAWLWIVIAIVVVALLWLAFGRSGHTPQTGALIDTGKPLVVATARALMSV